MGTWTSVERGWYWPCSEKKKWVFESYYIWYCRTYSVVQLDEHHETAGNELRHRDQNRIEQKRRLHGIGRGIIWEIQQTSSWFSCKKKSWENNYTLREQKRYIRLRSRSYTRHGKTDVDSRTHTTEEKLSFQENLSIRDRNDLFEIFEQAKLQVNNV